jgi:hypothetical protein
MRPAVPGLGRAKLLAKFLAFVEIANQGVGQERLRVAVVCDLELIVATRHVLDQVLHPKQGVATISHLGVFLHLNVEQGLSLNCGNSHTSFCTRGRQTLFIFFGPRVTWQEEEQRPCHSRTDERAWLATR